MNRKLLVVLVALPMPLAAHHSGIGRYDSDNVMEIEGEVVRVQWQNPHVYLSVEMEAGDGQTEIWQLEAGAPVRMQRAGISPDSVKVGDRIRAAGDSPLTEEKEIFVTNILVPSGEELLMRANVEPRWRSEVAGDYWFRFETEGDSSAPELGLFRVWATTLADPRLFNPTAVHADLANRYPLTEAGLATFRRFDPATDNPTRNCTPKGMPLIMDQPFPIEIVDNGNTIVIRIEEYDTVRTIHMDEDSVPADVSASILGYSVGRWEGSTLVVTTTHLNYPWVTQLGIPQSEQSELVERFTPADDGSQLDYQVTITDPVMFTGPVTEDKTLLYLRGLEVLEFDCSLRE